MSWLRALTSGTPSGDSARGFRDAGHGYDAFGFHPPTLRRAALASAWIFDHYFRVVSHGAENIPQTGPAIVVANHAGFLPVDGTLLGLGILRAAHRPARPVGDRFIPRLPWVGQFFSRVGVVSGTHANTRRLLEEDALLIIFPEGVTGTGKPFAKRYQLQDWRVGHAELAIRHRTPVVPAAIIGAEEAWPVLARLPARPFGAPYLPVPMSPVPLPVRIHLHFGPAIRLHHEVPADAADDPHVVAAAAARTRAAVEELIAHGLASRGER